MGTFDKRLLICSPGVPHESRGASTVLFYHYIERLKREGFNILNILLLQPDNYTERDLSEYIAKLGEHDVFKVLPCRAEAFIISRQFSFKLNTVPLEEVLQCAESFQPNATFCLDFLSAWVAAPITSGAKLVWLGDLNFLTYWYHAWYAARENVARVTHLPAMWVRSLVWKKIYREVLCKMDSIIVSSKSSEGHLKRLGIPAVYQPYPWPRGAKAVQASQVRCHKIPSFLFFGNLVGLGSRSTFHFMIGGLYPRLLRLWGRNGFQIFISGMYNLPDWVEEVLADKPEFKYLGFVNDIDSLMASCHAVLAPIDVPVGNRSRIVTAMAKGILVIAHQNTSLGNPDLVDGVTCYLANEADQFVERMQKAVYCHDQVEEIIANARACYNTRFYPEVATGMLVKELLRIMK